MERLGKLEQALNGGSVNFAPAAESPRELPPPAAFEKKTLIDPPEPEKPSLDETRESFPEEPPHFSANFAADDPAPIEEIAKQPAIASIGYDLGFLDSVNLPLPDIDSEDLEHVEDAWLDNAFDQRLLATGDDLMPIADAPDIAAEAIGGGSREKVAVTNGFSNGVGTATAPAREAAVYMPPVFDDEPTAEMPILSENSSEDELIAYAKAHPVVKKALRILGGTIVEVKKR